MNIKEWTCVYTSWFRSSMSQNAMTDGKEGLLPCSPLCLFEARGESYKGKLITYKR